MRRRIVSILAATLLVLLSALPAAAKGPERFWLTPEEILFGPEYCGFPVLLEDSFSSVKAMVFPPDGDGNQRIVQSGLFKSSLTNLADTGESTTLNLGGKITIYFRADGTVRAEGSGTILLWYSPAEAAVSELGSGLFLAHGRATERYGPAGNLVEATYTGRVTDLCAQLAG